MATLKLKRLLERNPDLHTLITRLVEAAPQPVAVLDTVGHLLCGTLDPAAPEHPVMQDDVMIGRVNGSDAATPIRELLDFVIRKEIERRQATGEVLELYREINLVYDLAEKLANSLDPQHIATLTLEEAGRFIDATGAALLIRRGDDERLAALAVTGDFPVAAVAEPTGLIGSLAAQPGAEILNDVAADPRRCGAETALQALIYAPLRTQQQTLGLIVLTSSVPVNYTAAALKLLSTVALQAAPAIENALVHARAMQTAREREAHLQQQIAELHIELDNARQERRVAEIVETDYFQMLRSQTDDLRRIMRARR